MAYPNITNILSAQKPAGIKKLYIKNGSEKWQTLGHIRNGEAKIMPYSTNNTYQQNLPNGTFTFEAKVELLQTSAAELENLEKILNGVSGVANDFLLALTDSAAIPTGGGAATIGWMTVSGTQVKPKARFVSDGNPSTTQFIELTLKGVLKASEINAAVKASIDDDDFHYSATADESFSNNNSIVGGTLWGYYTATKGGDIGVRANIKANGFASVAIDNPLSSGAETLTSFRNGKVELDFVAEEDSLGRPNVYGIKVNIEYESMLTDDTTLLLLDDINAVNTDAVVTLVDGKTFTLTSQTGIGIAFENVGDFDKMRVLRFTHSGIVPLTSTVLNAIVG